MNHGISSIVKSPPGYIDGEDGGGNTIAGEWRPFILENSRSAASMRYDFKDYFGSYVGEVCALDKIFFGVHCKHLYIRYSVYM